MKKNHMTTSAIIDESDKIEPSFRKQFQRRQFVKKEEEVIKEEVPYKKKQYPNPRKSYSQEKMEIPTVIVNREKEKVLVKEKEKVLIEEKEKVLVEEKERVLN